MIGSYQKEKLLGEGGFGKVYKCRDITDDQVYAIKEIRVTPPKLIEKKAMAIKEAEIMQKLNNHDQFVHCFDVFELNSAVYIVMEYYPMTLYDLVMAKSEKEKYHGFEDKAFKYLAQLIEGVRQLHALGLMHRDLKPKNILVGKSHDDIQMKIADFGLSKESLVGSTFCGTQHYVAPEIRKGQWHDKAVDIYSLGAVYYFMMFGKDPCLQFDRCGYPIIIDGFVEKHGHRDLMGRMMCERKDERISLDQIEEISDSSLSRGSCAICGKYLFYDKAEKEAIKKGINAKLAVAGGTALATLGVIALSAPIVALAPVAAFLGPAAAAISTNSIVSSLYDMYKLKKYE